MRCRLTPFRVRAALVAILAGLPGLALVHGQPDEPPARPRRAWTRDEALAQLRVYPRDPYLQYVALQLARRDNVHVADDVARLADLGDESRGRVDLFSIFTGALAVQESLQLDRMRGPGRQGDPRTAERAHAIVDVVNLKGPTIQSHPWQKMLAGRKPDVGTLARMVPEDFYLVEFRSVTKMLDLLDSADLWAGHLFNQAAHEARSQQVGERLRRQLAIETNRLLRPLYDGVVEEAAVTGSDLFLAEGSDVTLLFRLRQPELFRSRMDAFLDRAQKAHPDAKRSEGEYLGVKYVFVGTPERDLHVYSAYPEPGLHVRSSSKTGLQRVIEAIRGQTAAGKPVRRLGETTEFAYIRTLLPRGARAEDGFVYLSDPFIRRLVGPQLKLTERRRMLCYNHLRMIGHAALLYRTEHGRWPTALDELARTQCAPGIFNTGELVCPDGGKYRLSADGRCGVCSHHGHVHQLVPCCETALNWVTGAEADDYAAFLAEYNNYWRTYFDPIAVRIQVTPKQYRLETIVLPLIHNSIYQGLAHTLGGKPEPLDALPLPKRTIFSVAARFNKEALLRDAGLNAAGVREIEKQAARELGIPEEAARDLNLTEFLTRGLGDQVGLHVCDATPFFDLDVPGLFGLLFRNLNGRANLGSTELLVSFVVASFNAPVFLSLPVQDAQVVDRFLDRLDGPLAVVARRRDNWGGFLRFEEDFYRAKLKGGEVMRTFGFRVGPIKWRFHWARIGQGLYIASKPFLLEDLAAAHAAQGPPRPDPEATAHALVRLRPRHWERVLPDYRLGWAENNRQACLANLGPLASVSRAVRAVPAAKRDALAHRLADELYAVHFFCPEGGRYVLSADGKQCTCTVHGSAHAPRQELAPNEAASARALTQLGGLTAALTFLEDGLHAVLVIERK